MEKLFMGENKLKKLMKGLKIDCSPSLLKVALTHKSYANEKQKIEGGKIDSYERLEFLGDAVLGLVISDYIYHHFKGYEEGEMSKLKGTVVSESILAEIARKFDLGEYLFLGRGEENTGGRSRTSILADVVESIIAVVYLEKGLREAQRFVLRIFKDKIKSISRNEIKLDWKSALQEYVQSSANGLLPQYSLVGESGPDHKKTFIVEVSVEDNILGQGLGNSKKEAEQMAAAIAWERLAKDEKRRKTAEDKKARFVGKWGRKKKLGGLLRSQDL
ncbi:MAG: ribonuclease III [bacterium]